MAQRAQAGRGRHRKPRNTARTVGLATAPLAAVIPFALSSPAQAATTNTWERLASCESGGNWHINSGNGHYGGLQFSMGTWQSYGGTGMPHEQAAWRQAQVAERVRSSSGLGSWPHCGSHYG